MVLWANPWVFLAVVALSAVLSYREYDGIAAAYGFGAPGVLGYGAGALLLVIPYAGACQVMIVLALLGLVLAMRSADLAHALPRASLLVLGVIYVFGCWRCAIVLHDFGSHWLMYALLVSWTGDIGAYYVGKAFGRHRLADRVSPKKSWEGAAASVATSVLVAGAYLVHFAQVSVTAAVLLTAAGQRGGPVRRPGGIRHETRRGSEGLGSPAARPRRLPGPRGQRAVRDAAGRGLADGRRRVARECAAFPTRYNEILCL